jgi:hypothetical protein
VIYLVTKSDTSHTILDTKNVIVDRIDTVKLVTTRGAGDAELGVIDTREVEGTSGLHLAHGEAEWPREGGKIIEDVVGEIRAVHFRYDVVVIDVRCVSSKRASTVDV